VRAAERLAQQRLRVLQGQQLWQQRLAHHGQAARQPSGTRPVKQWECAARGSDDQRRPKIWAGPNSWAGRWVRRAGCCAGMAAPAPPPPPPPAPPSSIRTAPAADEGLDVVLAPLLQLLLGLGRRIGLRVVPLGARVISLAIRTHGQAGLLDLAVLLARARDIFLAPLRRGAPP
jgi:hypothetical protein